MSIVRVGGHFIGGSRGDLFVLVRQPAATPRGCVLWVPPFAEEMNKCRRMMTEVSHALVACGLASVVPDLFGTGDSSGEFRDATWAGWCDDIAAVARWAAESVGPVSGLVAIRLGAALVSDAAKCADFPPVRRTVLWQPVFDGSRHLTQFLRLRTAASLMEDRPETVAQLRARLADGEVIEVAGYEVGSVLAAELDDVKTPATLAPSLGAVAWYELVREAVAGLGVASAKLVTGYRERGSDLSDTAFEGEPFWASSEIVVNAGLARATVEHLTAARTAKVPA